MTPTPTINVLIQIAQQAGCLIMQIYNQPSFDVTNKADESPLTAADLASHHYIVEALQKAYPSIPILSEESDKEVAYAIRKNWTQFFLVDPLDGTKEFLQRNGEFTVNIAFMEKNTPRIGVIHAPALDVTYYAEKNKGAYKINKNNIMLLPHKAAHSHSVRIAVSRSHLCQDTQNFIENAKKNNAMVEEIPIGSALKFGLIAEGSADIYPRFSPTMEWDTAAGQIIVTEAGKAMIVIETGEPLLYNKNSLRNPGFFCSLTKRIPTKSL